MKTILKFEAKKTVEHSIKDGSTIDAYEFDVNVSTDITPEEIREITKKLEYTINRLKALA